MWIRSANGGIIFLPIESFTNQGIPILKSRASLNTRLTCAENANSISNFKTQLSPQSLLQKQTKV